MVDRGITLGCKSRVMLIRGATRCPVCSGCPDLISHLPFFVGVGSIRKMETERSLVDLRDAQIDTFIFSERVLFLDLEIETSTNGTGDKLIGAGALKGHRQYKLRQSRQPASWAIREMAPFASGAEMLVGHNIVDHDLVHLRRWWSNSPLSRLPVADTLFLSVLAKPQNPYHRLVKDYKLVGGEKNDPVGDCRLTRELLLVCGRLLAQWERSHPGVLSFYRSCFDATSTDLAGTGMMLERWGGESLPPSPVGRGVSIPYER